MRRSTSLAALCALLAACGQGSVPAPETTELPPPPPEFSAEMAAADARLVEMLDAFWEARVALDPEYQTRLGRKTNYDQWTPRTPEADELEAELMRRQIAVLREDINRDALSTEGQLNYDLFIAQSENSLALDAFRLKRYPLSQFSGIHSSIPVFLSNYHVIDNEADAKAYIARVSKVDEVLDQAASQLEAGAEAGATLPSFSYPLIAEAARNARSGDAVRDDFAEKVGEAGLENADALKAELEQALFGPYTEGYERFAARVDALAELTADEENLGVTRFDEDGALYAALLANYTTTDLTADEIHETGLAEVARIHEEMRGIMATVGFEGTLEEFFDAMRTDERFYLPNTAEGREAYLQLARDYIEGFRPKIDELFTIQPEASVEVRRVEPFRERSAGKAFYSQPDEEGTRPGYFYANLMRMEDMPTYQLEALVYHEAIPGHHMQRALQIEQTGLPMFRRFGSATAYTEGWGLYSELLPKEIGFYEDPYSDFGRLAMELWRAARLVVDTGLHAKGWTMDEAIAYLQENTPNPDGDSVKAIERYIVLPGQATAYKIGMLRIIELREKAKAELGENFDVRGFHDTILRTGPLPLDLLEKEIDRWIESERS
ncbi:DUF885 domain-containing protein [Parvularcula sp. ZS-1/3]|uniref:DUF885 domain-containing protein n=1 Tax=Parvularcula mediterranea TaxID=2732508 RepID=A0A7Y3W524_9PROT|nr:DUF885 domain-containing protein [Parvularcula mediterranea]NNU16355.1 DUF885 domain-containing protein [Parvularcula mediterranea]